jgi:hypothetical protein
MQVNSSSAAVFKTLFKTSSRLGAGRFSEMTLEALVHSDLLHHVLKLPLFLCVLLLHISL